jgi:hypothetical protein
LNGIEANLDDLQAGLEACSRAANRIDGDTANSDGLLKAPLRRSLLDHVKILRSCVRDQRAVVQELRRWVIELRNEETARQDMRPPPDVRAAASRSR